MPPDNFNRKLTAILSADVEGYSRLMSDDEAETVRTLTAYKEIITEIITKYRGRVVDSPGDNLLAEFGSVVDAVSCAVEMQKSLGSRNANLPKDRRMAFRIGINLGDVIAEDGRIYGDGVNIAARIEGLAEAGGICISGSVYDQINRKIRLKYDYLGEQKVKNISQPVRAYHIDINQDSDFTDAESPPIPTEFSSRPAIAILPFDNMSSDPDQEYFADGLAEDLITKLSFWRLFPVIARNSSFVYRGRAVDLKQVGKELNARYVIEGSVRKAGDRVRITAQLIDTKTGHHVWADRYDRDLRDIFLVQDEISEAIVASMYPELQHFETKQAGRGEPKNIDAWECYHRGYWHFFQLTKESNAMARSHFEKAVLLDPDFAPAFSALARSHQFDLVNQWADSPTESLSKSLQAAKRAVALDPEESCGHIALAFAYSQSGDHDQSIAAARLAVRLNPSYADAHANLAFHFALVGQADKALESIETALHLSPRDPEIWLRLSIAALAHLVANRYPEAIINAQQSIQRRPDWSFAHCILVVAYAHSGRIDKAKTALNDFREADPNFSTDGFRMFNPSNELLALFVDGLKLAGFIEKKE